MILSRTGVLFLLVLTLSCSSERLVSNLTPGDVLTFDWPINAPSEFLVECTAGQPEAFVLSQEGIDLEFEIWDPKGQSLFKWDSQTAGTGSEIAGLHPAQTGTYRLKVRAFHDETEGSFSIERISHSKKQYIEDIVLATETIFSAENLKANQRVDEFLTLLTKAKNIWLSHGNREQAAMTWWRVPAFMEQLSDQNGAVQGYREVVALLRQSDHSAMLALAYHRLGVAALRKGDSQSSMEALKQAIALRQRPDLDRAASILELGKCHTFSGQPQQSLPLLLEAQAIYEHLNYQPGLASLHGSIGWHYHHLGHYKKALTHYDKGLKWAKNFPKKQISILSYQAMTMIQIGESKRAIEALDRQRPLLESVGDPNEGLAFWKINRAEALLLQNRPRAAEPLLRESMDLLPEDVSAARAHLLFNLARAIAGQKDKSIDEAVAFMREALAYSDQLNFKNSAPESRMLYAVSRDGYADYLLDL